MDSYLTFVSQKSCCYTTINIENLYMLGVPEDDPTKNPEIILVFIIYFKLFVARGACCTKKKIDEFLEVCIFPQKFDTFQDLFDTTTKCHLSCDVSFNFASLQKTRIPTKLIDII